MNKRQKRHASLIEVNFVDIAGANSRREFYCQKSKQKQDCDIREIMDVLKITTLILVVIFSSNALPISKSNSSGDIMEDEWRTLQPCDKRSKHFHRINFCTRYHRSSFAPSSSAHLDGTDIIWIVQENVRTGELRYPHGKPGEGRHRRDVVSDTSRLWPNGIVYYSINTNLQGQGELYAIIL